MIIGDIYNKLYNLTKPPVNDAMKVMNLINGGEIVVRLIWQPVKSDTLFKNFDVDLHIVEPDGTHVYWNNMEGSVGFLDRDVEVAYWPDPTDDVETYAVCSRQPSPQPTTMPTTYPTTQPTTQPTTNQPSAQPISQSTLNTLSDTLYSNKMSSSSAKIGSDKSIHTHTYIATEEVSTGANENSKNPQVK